LIFDTKGNIFGGFTPLKWELGEWHFKADDSQKSFVFTLKNPHNFAAREFALQGEWKHREIACDSKCGPYFPGGFGISDNCDTNTRSCPDIFGLSDTNDTGLDCETFLTGWTNFQGKEIELFEIAD
jgi:hypothetical protein